MDELIRKFIAAFDAWAESSEWIDGPFFDAMLQAREALRAAEQPATPDAATSAAQVS